MCALQSDNSQRGNYTDDIIKMEEFYTKLYTSDSNSDTSFATADDWQVPPGTRDEVAMVLKAIKKGKSAGDDGIVADISCLGRYVVVEKLGDLFSQSLRTLTAPKACKIANLGVLHKQGDAKEPKIL